MIDAAALPVVAVTGLLVVALAGVSAWWYYSRESDDAGADVGAPDAGLDVVALGRDAYNAVAGTERKRNRLRMAGAVLVVLAILAAAAVTAFVGWGALAAVLFVGAFVLGVAAPPVAILMFRDGLPLGGLIGTGLAIAAQVAFGRAALVRREDGRYEWTVLRETADGFTAELSTGETVPIDADDGELFAFGFGKLAIAEQRGRNVDEFRATAGDTTRAGVPVEAPKASTGGIVVSLAKIQRRVRGSASSTLVRRGRDKALNDNGGTGQLSQLWTMAFAVVLLVVSFAMTAGVLML